MSNELEQCYKSLITTLAEQNIDTPLTEKTSKLVNIHAKLSPHVAEFDFENVHANGLRSFLCIIEAFIARCNAELMKKRHKWKNRKRLEEIIDIFVTIAEINEDIVVNNRSINEDEVMFKLLSVNKEVYFSLQKIGFFWLSPEVQRSFAKRNYFFAFGAKKWTALFSNRLRMKLAARYAIDVNIQEYINAQRFANSRWIAYGARKRNPVDRCEIIQINAITKHEILENGSLVEKKDANTVTIQLIQHGEDHRFDKMVIYHIHGGQNRSFGGGESVFAS